MGHRRQMITLLFRKPIDYRGATFLLIGYFHQSSKHSIGVTIERALHEFCRKFLWLVFFGAPSIELVFLPRQLSAWLITRCDANYQRGWHPLILQLLSFYAFLLLLCVITRN